MGLRFRRRIKLFPHFWLNASKSGVSASAGIEGLTVNLGGNDAVRTTISAPGTGLSYRTTTTARPATSRTQTSRGSSVPWAAIALALVLALAVAAVVYVASLR